VIPRVVVAGTGSGVGKTTVACGLMAALAARGRVVQPFKVGPDYIDPSYHTLACGREGRNLDAFLSGEDLIPPLVRHGSAGADIAVVEGVMGLFDGASGRGELASTAHVAKLLAAPVLLVVDARAMARSAAAVVLGFASYDPDLRLAGVILNRVGSDGHEALLREALEPLGVPVVGVLRRDESLAAPERHLGLVPAPEREAEARRALRRLAAAVAAGVDLAEVERIASSAPAMPGPTWTPAPEGAPERPLARIAVARGPAFGFHYRENLELLAGAGAEIAELDPLRDETLPAGTAALVLAGGFPEAFADALAENRRLGAEVAALARSGRPVIAECGGLLYLCRSLDGRPMCGVLPAAAEMTGTLTLGYREAAAEAGSACWARGEVVRGHEFHYSRVSPDDGAARPAWVLRARGAERPEGFVAGNVHASYLHTHWAAFPAAARRLVEAAARWG
jgi:cobyrinic acid a,c-diamide synthase